MRRAPLVLALCAILAIGETYLAYGAGVSKQYRNDYVYNSDTDAFYKFHIDGAIYSRAVRICELEGATLMSIEKHADIVQVHAMFKQYPDIENLVRVMKDSQEHESAEETPIINLEPDIQDMRGDMLQDQCDVLTRSGELDSAHCQNKLPFVCKVKAKDAPKDSNCGVYAKGYEYIESVGSCYKIPRVTYTWNQAYEECKAQGAHLVVLNSAAESREVKALMARSSYLHESYSMYYYIAGIRANRPTDGTPRVFRTIFNQTLEEAGFAEWADTEPNNYGNNEYCGSLYESDGKYNDHNCIHAYGFICEKEKARF